MLDGFMSRWSLLGAACVGLLAGDAAAQKTLLMHYMPWYKTPSVRGAWGGHWSGWGAHNPNNLINGLPDIYSHYHPLIGLYDSTERDVIECQLLQMKLAGVDGVIADWYGLSGTYDYAEIHQATLVLFDVASELDMQFAACFEDRTVEAQINTGALQPGQINGHMVSTFQWMDANWFVKPNYARFLGRPLLLNFGPIYLTDPAVWDLAQLAATEQPLIFSLPHLWRSVQTDGGFTWMYPSVWNNDPPEHIIKQKLYLEHMSVSSNPDEVVPSAMPGFDDIYAVSYPDIPFQGGETMRITLEAAIDGPWSHVQLATWNDYGEGTMIEPTHEWGYTFLEKIQAVRAGEIGPAFAFTPADLRLPARLLELRRAGNRDGCLLDAAAQALSAGNTAQAEAWIAQMEADPDAACTACAADMNADGVLDNGDLGAFIDAFLTVDLAADFTGDGVLDNGDIGAFVTAFLAGCE
ncbi:MAG: GC-type dockerin domain-anchored protein [Phycisphaerales bacterium JB040]